MLITKQRYEIILSDFYTYGYFNEIRSFTKQLASSFPKKVLRKLLPKLVHNCKNGIYFQI